MFCSACLRIDSEFHEHKRRICDSGHIFCKSCDKSNENCIICEDKILNFVHIEVSQNIPRISYSLISESQNEDLQDTTLENEEDNKSLDSDDSDNSLNQIMKQLNEYDNCCNKTECEKNPIIGCVQVIGHKADDVSLSITIDDEDEKEILKNFCGTKQKAQEYAKNQNPDQQKATSSKSNSIKKSQTMMQKQYSVKGSKSAVFGDRECSMIVNNSSTRQVLSESHHSCLSFTTRSECCTGSQQSVIQNSQNHSVYQLYKNEKSINESDTANFTSLSASRIEASPPEEKKDSKIPSNACRAKFVHVYRCERKCPAQMEPIDYFDASKDENEKEVIQNVAVNLPRLPISCPCSFCGMVTTPSDFFSHITIDHPYIDTIKLVPNKVVNCVFSPSGNINYVRCHQMFLLNGKISDIGHGPFKNCLPLLLLSCKLNLREVFGSMTLQNHNYQKSDEILCIWLTSVFQYPVNYSLNIWKHGRDSSEQNFIKCISTSSSCLNIKVSNMQLATSVMSLTSVEYEKVIDDENMIHCQVVFN